MPIPLVVSLIMQGLGKNNEMTSQQLAAEQAGKNSVADSIMQKRQQRAIAAENVPTPGITGLQGMDAMSPATARQMKIFNNVMGRYMPGQQAGGMAA